MNDNQLSLFDYKKDKNNLRNYGPFLTVSENRKGVLDVDTVKGCMLGMNAYPNGGCYGECYAAKNAALYGFYFTKSICRQLVSQWHRSTLTKVMLSFPQKWYRIGTAGDPCHDWTHTIAILRALRWTNKIPVIITKHWIELTDKQIDDLHWLSAVVNTSTSGLDTDAEISHRVKQLFRLRDGGVHSVLRVVTCNYGTSAWAKKCNEKQNYLLSLTPIIDNPLRARKSNPHVLNEDIILTRVNEAIGGGKLVSLHDSSPYLGTCRDCPDQCGVSSSVISNAREDNTRWRPYQFQMTLPRMIHKFPYSMKKQNLYTSKVLSDLDSKMMLPN